MTSIQLSQSISHPFPSSPFSRRYHKNYHVPKSLATPTPRSLGGGEGVGPRMIDIAASPCIPCPKYRARASISWPRIPGSSRIHRFAPRVVHQQRIYPMFRLPSFLAAVLLRGLAALGIVVVQACGEQHLARGPRLRSRLRTLTNLPVKTAYAPHRLHQPTRSSAQFHRTSRRAPRHPCSVDFHAGQVAPATRCSYGTCGT